MHAGGLLHIVPEEYSANNRNVTPVLIVTEQLVFPHRDINNTTFEHEHPSFDVYWENSSAFSCSGLEHAAKHWFTRTHLLVLTRDSEITYIFIQVNRCNFPQLPTFSTFLWNYFVMCNIHRGGQVSSPGLWDKQDFMSRLYIYFFSFIVAQQTSRFKNLRGGDHDSLLCFTKQKKVFIGYVAGGTVV